MSDKLRNNSDDEEEEFEVEGRGRSARKREILSYELLAEKLLEISDAKCEGLPVTDELKKAVFTARETTRSKAKAARKRYIKHLTSMLRSSDAEVDAINGFLAGSDFVPVTGDEAYRDLDALRSQLLDPATYRATVDQVCQQLPHIDLALLSSLSEKLQTQHNDKDYRNLYKELRRAADESERDDTD